jgi:hypothetical protein
MDMDIDSNANRTAHADHAIHATRISRRMLEAVADNLFERDWQVLKTIKIFRHLTTGQVEQLFFRSAATPTAALRAASRALAKLKDCGLILPLTRRIGGVRAGSSSFVWNLTEAGLRLLGMKAIGEEYTRTSTARTIRKRVFEPSPQYLKHTLAVAETYVQLNAICRTDGIELLSAQPEPICWRSYKNAEGKPAVLKPDLFVVTATTDYEDSYFFEVDLATEAPVRILEKCRRYLDFYDCRDKQAEGEVFPLVVWLAPDTKRRDTLRWHIGEEFQGAPRIFLVIAPEETETLITQGAEPFISQNPNDSEEGATP